MLRRGPCTQRGLVGRAGPGWTRAGKTSLVRKPQLLLSCRVRDAVSALSLARLLVSAPRRHLRSLRGFVAPPVPPPLPPPAGARSRSRRQASPRPLPAVTEQGGGLPGLGLAGSFLYSLLLYSCARKQPTLASSQSNQNRIFALPPFG